MMTTVYMYILHEHMYIYSSVQVQVGTHVGGPPAGCAVYTDPVVHMCTCSGMHRGTCAYNTHRDTYAHSHQQKYVY